MTENLESLDFVDIALVIIEFLDGDWLEGLVGANEVALPDLAEAAGPQGLALVDDEVAVSLVVLVLRIHIICPHPSLRRL